MEFRTIIDIKSSTWKIPPCENMLFVGSCFADNLGKRFVEEKFNALVNPFGVMYNPASVYHTVRKLHDTEQTKNCNVAVFTLGTNHVYILNETGEIVDNCMKRPQKLFTEKELSIDECCSYLIKTINLLRDDNPNVKVVFTVSPIRYRKYGYHESQLSKAILQLAVKKVIDCGAMDGACASEEQPESVTTNNIVTAKEIDTVPTGTSETGANAIPSVSDIVYFPAYEIVLDELRDYRFYKEDMLHPSEQAVNYIYERFSKTFFNEETFNFLSEWKPLKEALGHKPLHPDSKEYKEFMNKTMLKVEALSKKYNTFAL